MAADTQYDIVITGGGLGGLLCAVLLAKEGMKVCVLEQNKQIGGCLQTFAQDKRVIDSCVHYIGGLGEGHSLNAIFRYAGIMDNLQLKELDRNGYDRICFAGDEPMYPLACGEELFKEQLLPYFPTDRDAVSKYLELVKYTTDHFPLYNLRNGAAAEKAMVTELELTAALQSITQDHKLQNVLTGNSMLYAGYAGKTPFYLHALVTSSYMLSAHKIMPGSSEISKLLWKELQRHGGTVYRGNAVTCLAEVNGKIDYAETAGGTRYYGKRFIAAISPTKLLELTDSKLLKPVFRKRVRGLTQTTSAFITNIVLKPGTVCYRNYNIYHQQSNAPGASLLPAAVGNSLAIYSTEDYNLPGYAATLSLLVYMDFAIFEKWADSHNTTAKPHERDNEYKELKERLEQKATATAMGILPEVKGNILSVSSSSPLSFRDYTGSPEGSLYGIMKNVDTPAATTISTRTGIPNLFFTGQNVNLHGVLGVSMTAISTCAELVGMEYLLGKILKT